MSYTFTPWHTGLVAHIGDLDSDGVFYVEARPCIGYATLISRYRGEESPQTSLAVLDDEFPYLVRALDRIDESSPAAVVVAILPADARPTPAQLAEGERLSRLSMALYEHRSPQPFIPGRRTAA
jgi:hypothetical protein